MEKKPKVRYSAKFKAEVALKALVGATTIADIAAEYGVHPVTVSTWKKEALEGVPDIFDKREAIAVCDCTEQSDALYRKIGQLTVEMERLKKSA